MYVASNNKTFLSLHVRMSDILVRLQTNLDFLDTFAFKYPTTNFIEICHLAASLMDADRRTDSRQTDMTVAIGDA